MSIKEQKINNLFEAITALKGYWLSLNKNTYSKFENIFPNKLSVSDLLIAFIKPVKSLFERAEV